MKRKTQQSKMGFTAKDVMWVVVIMAIIGAVLAIPSILYYLGALGK